MDRETMRRGDRETERDCIPRARDCASYKGNAGKRRANYRTWQRHETENISGSGTVAESQPYFAPRATKGKERGG